MWPRFQRGHPLLLDGKTQSQAAGANAAIRRQVAEAIAVSDAAQMLKPMVRSDPCAWPQARMSQELLKGRRRHDEAEAIQERVSVIAQAAQREVAAAPVTLEATHEHEIHCGRVKPSDIIFCVTGDNRCADPGTEGLDATSVEVERAAGGEVHLRSGTAALQLIAYPRDGYLAILDIDSAGIRGSVEREVEEAATAKVATTGGTPPLQVMSELSSRSDVTVD